ncbi:MAG TPA: hypothetical protein VK908_09670 [Jiangellales bacterium]|nr:hypothetical protein [Jiangellales bacterium]
MVRRKVRHAQVAGARHHTRPAHRQEGDLWRGRIAVALVPVGAVVAISGLAVAY